MLFVGKRYGFERGLCDPQHAEAGLGKPLHFFCHNVSLLAVHMTQVRNRLGSSLCADGKPSCRIALPHMTDSEQVRQERVFAGKLPIRMQMFGVTQIAIADFSYSLFHRIERRRAGSKNSKLNQGMEFLRQNETGV